jgi:aspartate aminotransferase-like enzyme
METYPIPLIPGPTSVPEAVRAAYLVDYGSSDIEPEFFGLYAETQRQLQEILGTRNKIAIMTGEAMVVLWGALKSCLQPGDRVLAVATGVFGYGIAEMARGIGAEVQTVGFGYDEIADPGRVEEAIRFFRPKMLTLVHCETPSGTLNPAREIGELVREYDVPLYYVDAVASAGGAPLEVDAWRIDLCLLGTQKCFSVPPDLGMVSVSDRAWQIIRQVSYQGYDALIPWENALEQRWFPYTPSWHSIAALSVSCRDLLAEGVVEAQRRHAEVAALCRDRVTEMGLELFARPTACSPTVTPVKVPEFTDWPTLDQALRKRGIVFGGSLEKLAGKVFRIGHMGSQARSELVKAAMDALEEVVHELRD